MRFMQAALAYLQNGMVLSEDCACPNVVFNGLLDYAWVVYVVLAPTITTGCFVKVMLWNSAAELRQSSNTAQLRETLRQGCGKAAAAAAEKPSQLQQLQTLQLQQLLPRQLQPLLRLRWCLLL